jgi:hypothetical protein
MDGIGVMFWKGAFQQAFQISVFLWKTSMTDSTQVELLTAQLKAQHCEILLLKYDIIKRDFVMLAKQVQISTVSMDLQDRLKSMIGSKPLPACVLQVNMKWMQKVPTCPYVSNRGKNKGVACGQHTYLRGASQLNPYCDKHEKQWRLSDLYVEYIAEYAQAEAADRKRQQDEVKEERQKCVDELKNNRDVVSDLVKRLTELIADDTEHRVLPKSSEEMLLQLRDCRESLDTTYANFLTESAKSIAE